MDNYFFEDFTEEQFRELLVLAKNQGYQFITGDQLASPGRLVLWRHDVDYSMHRALKLAQIENNEGVRATYFVNLHSTFYNALENEIADIVKQISDLHHCIGIHHDAAFYQSRHYKIELAESLELEKDIFQKIFHVLPEAVSFHNPDLMPPPSDDKICGMINFYGQALKKNFSYCSDSNGHWRHRRLKAVFEEAQDERLHVLTHPEWWTPEVMSPRQRIMRCIEGRAQKQQTTYDDLLDRSSRKNIS